jgi:hypothetical protein
LEIEKGENQMTLFKNRFVQAVAALGVVATLALVTPRAAHAVAAALVQVTNTAASPAITQDTSKRAGQLVELICGASTENVTQNSSSSCYEFSLANASGPPPPYSVPTGQNLVITSVELNDSAGYTGNNLLYLGDLAQGINYHQWAFSGPNTLQFQYPSGIALSSGTAPVVASTNGGAFIQITGYLTSN